MSSLSESASPNSTQLVLDQAVYSATFFATRRLVPVFMAESVAFGVASTGLLLYIYILLRHQHSWKEIAGRAFLSISAYSTLTTHWALTYRYIIDILVGTPFESLGPHGSTALSADFQTYFPLFIGEAFLFGALTALVLIVVVLSLRGDSPNLSGWNKIPFLTVFVMYGLALTHWTIGFSSFMDYYRKYNPSNPNGWTGLLYGQTAFVLATSFAATVLFSDAIVLWRACAVWPKNKPILYTCVSLFLTTFVFATVNLVLMSRAGQTGFRVLPGIPYGFFFSIPAYFVFVLSLLSNIFSFCAIGYKAWTHRQTIKAHLTASRSRRFTAEKVLAILVESSAVYLVLWILYFAASVVNIPPSFAYFMTQITAAYPTIIIILVMVEKTSLAREAVVSTPSRVVLPPIQVTLGTIVNAPPPCFTPSHIPVTLGRVISLSSSHSSIPTEEEKREEKSVVGVV
ncbi:hypothetical protein K488DRAFT_91214 [Vararia minispora EC-137]|uniref:Uncharacterized protein n=1 Tax=Vararia minispora EC-137 TaxID=1314806 RepID=A0ACB8Q680_9AGAM|nr:hypothetical protein K488DRAFT_91214 [Vararia minispora EC-137]